MYSVTDIRNVVRHPKPWYECLVTQLDVQLGLLLSEEIYGIRLWDLFFSGVCFVFMFYRMCIAICGCLSGSKPTSFQGNKIP